MGLLEKLGLRDDPSATFSEWLDEQLFVTSSTLKAGDGLFVPSFLAELDEKVAGFVRQHGDAALVKAIDQWVDRTSIKDVFFGTRIFRSRPEERDAWARALSEQSPHGATGFLALEAALNATGVLLAHDMVQPLPPGEPHGALSAIGDALWPWKDADGATRDRLAAAAEMSRDEAAWQLLSLRYYTMGVGLSVGVKSQTGPGEEVEIYVQNRLMERLRGFPGYRGIEHTRERLRESVRGYREALEPEIKEGKVRNGSAPTLIGREFASQCGARHAIDIRAIGAREFVGTYRLVAATAGAWFEHRQAIG